MQLWTSTVEDTRCSEHRTGLFIYYVIAVRARRIVRILFLPYFGNRSKSDPCSYELFCLESHIIISEIIADSSWITLYTFSYVTEDGSYILKSSS